MELEQTNSNKIRRGAVASASSIEDGGKVEENLDSLDEGDTSTK